MDPRLSDKSSVLKDENFHINPRCSNLIYNYIIETANKNIRYKSNSEEDFRKLTAPSMSGLNNGVAKEFQKNNQHINKKIYMSHLTPNRTVNLFHNMRPNNVGGMPKAHLSEKIYNKLDHNTLFRAKKKTQILIYNMKFVLSKIEVISSKLDEGSNNKGRKGAILMDRSNQDQIQSVSKLKRLQTMSIYNEF